MKFLNEQGQEIILKRAENLPGYEVTLAEDTVIDSAVDNPFFKGINVLQLPKKLKGFRDNPDLQKILEPKAVNTDIILEVSNNEFCIFELDKTLVSTKRLILINKLFGNNEEVKPLLINYGLKRIVLKRNTKIGNLFVLKSDQFGVD